METSPVGRSRLLDRVELGKVEVHSISRSFYHLIPLSIYTWINAYSTLIYTHMDMHTIMYYIICDWIFNFKLGFS